MDVENSKREADRNDFNAEAFLAEVGKQRGWDRLFMKPIIDAARQAAPNLPPATKKQRPEDDHPPKPKNPPKIHFRK